MPVGAPTVTGRGRVAFTITWPELTADSRLVPAAARSIKFQVFSLQPVSDEVIHETVALRPADGSTTSTIVLDPVPSIKVKIVATAHPNTDGTGIAQAAGTVEMTVEENKTASQALTMTSTITEVRVVPANPVVGSGQTLTLSASGHDAQGALVLTSGTKWEWVSSAPGTASVQSSGLTSSAQGLRPGTTEVTARDTESGKSATVALTVSDAPGAIVITPNDTRVDCGESKGFSASLPGVIWGVSGGGTISKSGVFTADHTPGEFTVTASKDGAAGSATVTVFCPTVFGRWGGTDGGQLEAVDVSSDVVSDDGHVVNSPWFVQVDEFQKIARVTRRFSTGILIGPQRFVEFPAISANFNLTGTPQHMTGTSPDGATIDLRAVTLPEPFPPVEFLELRITGLPGLVQYHAEVFVAPNGESRIVRTEVQENSTWVCDNRERTPSGVPRSLMFR
jgi:hypothetical protein